VTKQSGNGEIVELIRDPISGRYIGNNPGGPGRYVGSRNHYNKITRRIVESHTAKHMQRALDATFRQYPHFYVKWGLDYIARMHGKHPDQERDGYFDDLGNVKEVFARLFDESPDTTMAVVEHGIAALNIQQLEKVAELVDKRMSTLNHRVRLPTPCDQG